MLKHSNVKVGVGACTQFHLSTYSLHASFARNVLVILLQLLQVTGGLAIDMTHAYTLDTSIQ